MACVSKNQLTQQKKQNTQPIMFKIGFVFVAVYFLWAYLPVLQGYFGFFVNEIYAIAFLALFALGWVFLTTSNGRIAINPLLMVSIAYIFFHFLFILSGSVNTLAHIYRALIYWSSFLVYNAVKNNKQAATKLTWYCLGLFFITLATSAIGITTQTGIARVLTASTAETIEENIAIYRANVGGVQFFQMLNLFVPVLMYLYWNAKKLRTKILAIIGLLVTCFVLIEASFTIALITYFIAIALSAFLLKNAKLGALLLLAISAVLFVVPWSNLFLSLSENINNAYISIRFRELSYFFSRGEFTGDFADRLGLYMRSLDTFIHNPFGIGPIYTNVVINGHRGIGYHSQIFDDLARFGVLAVPFYIVFIRSYYKILERQWRKLNTPSIALIVVVLYIMMLTMNLGTTSIYESVICFIILPSIPDVILMKKKTEVRDL